MVSGLFAMAGVWLSFWSSSFLDFLLFKVEVSHDELLDCTEDIMEAIDVDGDGDITQVEEISIATYLM